MIRNTYCATALLYDSQWIDNSLLDEMILEKWKSEFAGKPVDIEFYKDGDQLMVKWKTLLLVPDDTYYLDMEIDAEADVSGKVVKINAIPSISITGVRNDDEGFSKIRRWKRV